MSRRTAARNASHLLPHLQSGMRVLDCGCGGGSITLGLAEASAPGDVIGIDASAENIAQAQAHADERGLRNVRFLVGDATALPLEDGAFDAVFAHALLQHLTDPQAAAREFHRVAKQGAVVSVSDADYGGGVISPSDPALESAVALMGALHAAEGRSPYVGRSLGALLETAGFAKVTLASAAHLDPTAEARTATAQFWSGYFTAPAVADHIIALGLATRDDLAAIPAAWARWAATPGATWVRLWFDAVAWK